MSHQLYNIATPSVHMIPGGLHEGKQIIIRGRMYDGGEGFSINFQHEQWDGSPIAFHFNPRHSERIIVRNSFRDSWENEERKDVYYYPFGDYQEFSVRILVTESEYKVYGDGYHVLDFFHRHAYQDVNYIRVDGDCHIYDMAFQDKLRPPYVGRIPGNFQVGKAVRIRGVVKDDSEGTFKLNMQCDHAGQEVAFHFNPRSAEGAVVRNALLGGDWGEEEREAQQFPFAPNSFFDMFCVATDVAYATYVNGEFFTNFGFRSPVEQVSHLAIDGDIEIADIEYFDQTRDNVCKEIPSGLKKGDTILVRGVFNPEGETFSINLHHEMDSSSDIAFHFNPRRSEGEVVLNSCYGGEWGAEERQELPWMFRESLPFDLRLVAKRNKVKVYVNGEYISKFEVRNPILDIVKCVSMKGDAFIHQIKLQREVKPPHFERLPGLISDNQWIRFTGTIKKDCEQFSVNLLCGPDEESDIAFHLNPRLSSGVAVRNSYQGSEWQSEETDQPHFPFQHKDFFEVVLCVKPEVIKVYVNGKYFVDFYHRVPYEAITHVKTAGDANFFQPEYF